VPLNLTLVAPEKLAPVIVTDVPTVPLLGENESMTGGGAVTVKSAPLVAVPPGVVTVILPVVAPAGTDVLISVLDTTVKVAAVPLKRTLLASLKFLPEITTGVPTGPRVGVKEMIAGAGGVTVKSESLDTVPPDVETLIGPVVAPAGTVVLI